MFTAPSNRRALFVTAWMLAGTIAAVAQYSRGAQSLRKTSELYDERGYAQSKAVTVDGRLSVAPSHAGVAYAYPVAQRTIHGFPINVSLNYCGSVAFTTYTAYDQGSLLAPHSRWARFHQNRPAWMIGVNGFALQVLSYASSFHCDPSISALYTSGIRTAYGDSDFVWTIDGYDVCNRMDRLPIANPENTSTYVDVIRLLRDDGSLLELVNTRLQSTTSAENRSDLYTGHYRVNEANAHGYGVVEFDSTYWPVHIRQYAHYGIRYSYPLYPFIPRRLRYFAGDGLEYRFREWVVPFGLHPYADSTLRYGGMWAGPTVFYLEEILSNDVVLTRAKRSRHYPMYIDEPGRIGPDSTKGRALFTGLEGVCEVLYGKRSIALEAGGRTIQALFDTLAYSGASGSGEHLPLAQLGYTNAWSVGMAAVGESGIPYRSIVGYVTRVIDPAGRVTRFRYERYRRRFRGFGFPLDGSSVEVGLGNWRLVEIDEPTSRYAICYHKGDVRNPAVGDECDASLSDELMTYNTSSAGNPSALNNMARTVEKYDQDGTLLLTDEYSFSDYNTESSSFATAVHRATDHPAGTARTMTYSFQRYALPAIHPYEPAPVFTALGTVREDAASTRTISTTYYARPTASWYLWMPTRTMTTVNGVRKSERDYSYVADTVRRYGSNASLTEAAGWEIMRAIARTRNPDSTLRLVDTIDYRHFPYRDTVVTRVTRNYIKTRSLQRFLELQADQNDTTFARRKWEEVMFDPRVAVYALDTTVGLVTRTPHFGVEVRSVTADADGSVLTGRRTVLHGDNAQADDLASPALPVARIVIGRGGSSSITSETLAYGAGWTRNLPVVRTDANGARTLTAYDSLRDGPYTAHPLPRAGVRLTDDDSLRAQRLLGIAPELIEEPIGSARLVRKTTPSRDIVVDTNMTELERSYFGQVSAARDANGWLTRSLFDRNGRLTAAWLPGDYARVSPPDTFYYRGPDSVDLYGITSFTRRIDTLRCLITQTAPPTYPRAIGTGTVPVITSEAGKLYAGMPVMRRERCPCADTGSSARGKSGPTLLGDCSDTLTYQMLGEYPGYRGHLFFRYDRGSILRSLERLDSALLRLYVTNVEGECVSVRVSIDAFGFARSYLFNCPSLEPENSTRAAGGTGLQSVTTALRRYRTVQGPYLDVRLDSILQKLLAMQVNDTFGIEVRVTSAGTGIRFASGADAADVRPKLVLYGLYKTISDTVDYTLAMRHVDDSLMTEVMAKTDDLRHTSSQWPVNRYHADIRRSRIRHYFGADFRHRFSEITIGEPGVPSRIDTVAFAYTGGGMRTEETDQLGGTITHRFDGLGRRTRVEYQDESASTTDYTVGTPASCGINEDGQDFLGFCSATVTTDENGARRAVYRDAFDRVRREVNALGTLDLTTRYDYDLLGNVTRVINPNGDTTRYWYDAFGRVRYTAQPDLGVVSLSHDEVGNVRFSQSADQAFNNLVTYTQYDDLGRVTLVGEASINDGAAREKRSEAGLNGGGYENPPLELARFTDLLDGNRIHTGMPTDAIATVNTTLFKPALPVPAQPRVWAYNTQTRVPFGCQLRPTAILAERNAPSEPYISHPIAYYEPIATPPASLTDFEDVARYPHFARMAMHYDGLPDAAGAVWSAFPAMADWNSLAPKGTPRNLRGREAAVAWREHGGEPWHYAVMSYDERGRIEALLRYTDNVGFDAVYYQYNALNLVTSVRVADPLNQHTTWYGYDHNGKLDTIRTLLEQGNGIGLGTPRRPKMPLPPVQPDVVFSYSRTGHVASMSYPPASLAVSYAYNPRKWIDSIVARNTAANPGSDPLFRQRIGYDATGQMTTQRSSFSGVPETVYGYAYDGAQRLTRWTDGVFSESFVLDRIGNRTAMLGDRLWVRTTYKYAPPVTGPNRLERTQAWNSRLDWQRLDYAYDLDGAVTGRQRTDSSGFGIRVAPPEAFTYSYRELLRRYTYNGATHDWRYRYSPLGEREQKRLYPVSQANPASSNENPWAYWLLGAASEQLAEWHGREIYQTACMNGVPVGTAWMYPVGYNCIGGGLTRVTTRPDVAVPGGRKEYYVADGLGSTRLVVAAGGTVIEQIEYDPFGRPLLGPTSTPQTYVGRQTDAENGLADHGVRKYEPAEGRFLSVDPRWESFRNVSPYQYAHANPLNRFDPNGQWDIVVHVAKDRSQHGYGIAVVTDRKGNEVFRFTVRVEGQGRDRTKRNGDTPLGVYDIPAGKEKWISGKSRDAYGPNPRLRLDPQSGEIASSGRSEIRIHGGRQETRSGSEYAPKENPTLQATHGCMRAYDNTMKSLKEVTDDLEANDAEEEGGTVTVVDDLDVQDGVAVIPNDQLNQASTR
jgi:RHS repeat-associated protein